MSSLYTLTTINRIASTIHEWRINDVRGLRYACGIEVLFGIYCCRWNAKVFRERWTAITEREITKFQIQIQIKYGTFGHLHIISFLSLAHSEMSAGRLNSEFIHLLNYVRRYIHPFNRSWLTDDDQNIFFFATISLPLSTRKTYCRGYVGTRETRQFSF